HLHIDRTNFLSRHHTSRPPRHFRISTSHSDIMTRINPATKGNARQVATIQGFTPDYTGSASIKSSGFTDQQLDELSHLMILTINHAFDERSKANSSTPAASRPSTIGQTGTSVLPPADFTPGQIEILSE